MTTLLTYNPHLLLYLSRRATCCTVLSSRPPLLSTLSQGVSPCGFLLFVSSSLGLVLVHISSSAALSAKCTRRVPLLDTSVLGTHPLSCFSVVYARWVTLPCGVQEVPLFVYSLPPLTHFLHPLCAIAISRSSHLFDLRWKSPSPPKLCYSTGVLDPRKGFLPVETFSILAYVPILLKNFCQVQPPRIYPTASTRQFQSWISDFRSVVMRICV